MPVCASCDKTYSSTRLNWLREYCGRCEAIAELKGGGAESAAALAALETTPACSGCGRVHVRFATEALCNKCKEHADHLAPEAGIVAIDPALEGAYSTQVTTAPTLSRENSIASLYTMSLSACSQSTKNMDSVAVQYVPAKKASTFPSRRPGMKGTATAPPRLPRGSFAMAGDPEYLTVKWFFTTHQGMRTPAHALAVTQVAKYSIHENVADVIHNGLSSVQSAYDDWYRSHEDKVDEEGAPFTGLVPLLDRLDCAIYLQRASHRMKFESAWFGITLFDLIAELLNHEEVLAGLFLALPTNKEKKTMCLIAQKYKPLLEIRVEISFEKYERRSAAALPPTSAWAAAAAANLAVEPTTEATTSAFSPVSLPEEWFASGSPTPADSEAVALGKRNEPDSDLIDEAREPFPRCRTDAFKPDAEYAPPLTSVITGEYTVHKDGINFKARSQSLRLALDSYASQAGRKFSITQAYALNGTNDNPSIVVLKKHFECAANDDDNHKHVVAAIDELLWLRRFWSMFVLDLKRAGLDSDLVCSIETESALEYQVDQGHLERSDYETVDEHGRKGTQWPLAERYLISRFIAGPFFAYEPAKELYEGVFALTDPIGSLIDAFSHFVTKTALRDSGDFTSLVRLQGGRHGLRFVLFDVEFGPMRVESPAPVAHSCGDICNKLGLSSAMDKGKGRDVTVAE